VQESVKVGDRFPVSELVASVGQRLDLESLAGQALDAARALEAS
jgi:hypothetical protein